MNKSLAVLVLLAATLVGCKTGSSSASKKPAVFRSYMADADAEPSADPESPFWKDVKKGVSITKSVLGTNQLQFRAEVRSRWTKDNVYFLFYGPYEKITVSANPNTTTETFKMWERDCFEVYLGADMVHTNLYREFQMSPAGEFLDLNIDCTKSNIGMNGEDKWNSGFKVKARIDEAKKMIYGEFKIPIIAVDTRPAAVGNEMQINLYRQDGVPPNRDFLAWQPPMVWNPHHPEIFGRLRFVK
jgi:hypothetical protein